MNINFHPEIKENDFIKMREHYEDYLRFHNYNSIEIKHMLASFDNLLIKKDYNTIYNQMRGIGVILMPENVKEIN